MPVELRAHIHASADAPEVPHGWRGLLDFGEVWTEEDAHLHYGESAIPLGSPLTYGCELVRQRADAPGQVRLRIWSLDRPREAMKAGARFKLRDGHTERAAGQLM